MVVFDRRGSSGPCEFSLPIGSWYPAASQINGGYVVAATQSSRLYPAMKGSAYPEWYDYGHAGTGATPPTNVVPTTEPNGTKSCIAHGVGYACLDAHQPASFVPSRVLLVQGDLTHVRSV